MSNKGEKWSRKCQLNTAAFEAKHRAGCKESRDTQRGTEWLLLCSKSSTSWRKETEMWSTGGKEDYKRALIRKSLFKDALFFSGKHNSYKKWICPFPYTCHAVHVVTSESGLLKGPSFLLAIIRGKWVWKTRTTCLLFNVRSLLGSTICTIWIYECIIYFHVNLRRIWSDYVFVDYLPG